MTDDCGEVDGAPHTRGQSRCQSPRELLGVGRMALPLGRCLWTRTGSSLPLICVAVREVHAQGHVAEQPGLEQQVAELPSASRDRHATTGPEWLSNALPLTKPLGAAS